MTTSSDDPESAQLGPYTLISKLGQGGMGVVHRAHDTRLRREVAIKLLPESLRADPERRSRFLREARAAAQLSHPNITPIFDVGEADGRDYIAFELVEGCTLAERIAGHELDLAELIDLALPLADAIAYAHERGVVHRDIKPGNVMVTPRGHPKLLDFGLAKFLDEDSQAPGSKHSTMLTEEGAIFGTPGAMSPEQALGKPVDARSDVFSFGSLVYEMAAGRPPFRGATPMDVVQAVIQREPDPLGRMRPDLPPELVACIAKAMRKDRNERYQTMLDLAADLRHFRRATDSVRVPPVRARGRRLGVLVAAAVLVLGGVGWFGWRALHSDTNATSSAPERRSLAVLPFTNLGGSPEDAGFTAGLHSDVLTRLARVASLKVIARTSVLEYATNVRPLQQIGRELGVGAILSGEVQRAGTSLRLNLTLHDAASEDSLWADSYDRELTSKNLFAVQSEIAEAVAAALKAQLSPADEQRLRRVPTTNDEAYDAYLTGMALIGPDREQTARGISNLEKSVALDPRFAVAWATLADVRAQRFWSFEPGNRQLLASAFDAARRALAIDPDLPEGHAQLGHCHYIARDYEAAEREYAIAEIGLPSSAELMESRASLYRRMGRWQESIDAHRRTIELSPRKRKLHWSLAMTLVLVGDYAEALRHMDLESALSQRSPKTHYYYWTLLTSRDGRVPPEAFELQPGGDHEDADQHILRWRLRLFARDPHTARSDAAAAPELVEYQWHAYPRALLVAIAAELDGDAAAARLDYERARDVARTQIAANPEDARLHAALALSLAGLDERDEALREARLATDMLPLERDAIVGSSQLLDRMYTELRVGALDDAVRTLDTYLAHPALYSASALVLDPRLDALAGHAGFEALRKREAKKR